MNTPHFALPTHLALRLLGAAVLATAACAANAATTSGTPLSPKAQYQADVAHCKSGLSNQNQATCLQEAGAALEAAKHGKLTTSPSYTADRTARCQQLPADQQKNCMTMMSDQANTKVEGSVGGGGVLRETTITVPADSQ